MFPYPVQCCFSTYQFAVRGSIKFPRIKMYFYFKTLEIWFWCKNKTKENKAHIFLTESYLMLQVQTIDG
ncbi:UNVERIFIED_CONTAM: hypothetical protein FOS07_02655 [Bacillus mycoides]